LLQADGDRPSFVVVHDALNVLVNPLAIQVVPEVPGQLIRHGGFDVTGSKVDGRRPSPGIDNTDRPNCPSEYCAASAAGRSSHTQFGLSAAISAHSDDVDQSFRSDADQNGAKRRRALSV